MTPNAQSLGPKSLDECSVDSASVYQYEMRIIQDVNAAKEASLKPNVFKRLGQSDKENENDDVEFLHRPKNMSFLSQSNVHANHFRSISNIEELRFCNSDINLNSPIIKEKLFLL